MEFVRPGGDGHLRNASTLLLPAVSIGNAGQLAVDLLVSTLGVRRAGFLEEPHVLPCVGNDPFGPSAEGKLTVALEVYEYEDQGLSVVQQRAPVVKGAMMKYAKNMAAWAACEGIKEVIVLSGLDSGKRQRHDMDLSQIQYISTASKDGSDGHCEALGWKRLEQYLPLSEAWQLLDRDSVTDPVVDNELSPEVHSTDDAYFPGLPFASIFSSCKAEGLKVVCVLCFCAEGDNVPDAFLIADAVQQYLYHGKSEASGSTEGLQGLNWNGRSLSLGQQFMDHHLTAPCSVDVVQLHTSILYIYCLQGNEHQLPSFVRVHCSTLSLVHSSASTEGTLMKMSKLSARLNQHPPVPCERWMVVSRQIVKTVITYV